MESELLKLATSQGIWAALSVSLIFYIFKTYEKRETKHEESKQAYQNSLLELAGQLELIRSMKEDLKVIKKSIEAKINK